MLLPNNTFSEPCKVGSKEGRIMQYHSNFRIVFFSLPDGRCIRRWTGGDWEMQMWQRSKLVWKPVIGHVGIFEQKYQKMIAKGECPNGDDV